MSYSYWTTTRWAWTGHLGPIKVPSAFYWAASHDPGQHRCLFLQGRQWLGRESGPSLEVVIKSKPWALGRWLQRLLLSGLRQRLETNIGGPGPPDSRCRWWMGSLTLWSKLIIASPTTFIHFCKRAIHYPDVTLPMSSPEIALSLAAWVSHHISPLT